MNLLAVTFDFCNVQEKANQVFPFCLDGIQQWLTPPISPKGYNLQGTI